jgi:FOG: PKD repeat
MKMKKLNPILLMLAIALTIPASLHAKKRKVLFIGNSYIHTNNMPDILKQLCTAMGDTLEYSQNTPGGYTLEAHSTDPTTLGLINGSVYDIVILQEQSQRPAFPQSQVDMDTYPYAKDLYDAVKTHNSCGEVMFMMTWGYKNGDASNCAFHPPICTYAGMQNELRFSYMKMAKDNNSNVAPVGAAWKVVRDSFPAIELYSPDNSHPSVSGSYLEACVLYASIFHKSPMGANYTAGINAGDAANLQYIADIVALDSLEKWQEYGNYPYANFELNSSGMMSIATQNTSKRAANFAWDFGDGTGSTLLHPTKNYSSIGKYPVTLMASNNCSKDIKVDTVEIGFITGVNDVLKEQLATVHYTADGDSYLQVNDVNAEVKEVVLYDMSGRKAKTISVTERHQNIKMDIAPGTYIYKLYGSRGDVGAGGKLIKR